MSIPSDDEAVVARRSDRQVDTGRVRAEYERLGPNYEVRTPLNAFGRGPGEQETLTVLLGNVAGLRVLDAACAAGRLTGWLADQGAHALGLDVTPTMLQAARLRVGDRAHLIQGDLATPLPIRDSAFDIVLSAFTLHYLQDWSGVLREFSRVLRPEGALVLSIHHPFNDVEFATHRAYFETAEASDTWLASDGMPAAVHFYRRPLSAIFESLYAAGFLVERALEAPPDLLRAPTAVDLTPWFLCIRGVKRGG